MNQYHPDDRPTPEEKPMHARVPEHVSSGAFSTGVIVMTANTEFILDFVQNLGRPHQIVARIIMPHNVLPQLVGALQRNIDLYRRRWGELPVTPVPRPAADAPAAENPFGGVQYAGLPADPKSPEETPEPRPPASDSAIPAAGGAAGGPAHPGPQPVTSEADAEKPPTPEQPASGNPPGPNPPGARQATAEEVYDDLKIKDELLSGAYANAVMIGHGAHEFSFDFITNFYPHSAVSSRVFLAAGQVPRLFDSLKGTWDQMQARVQSRDPRSPAPPQANPGPDSPGGTDASPDMPTGDSDPGSDGSGDNV